MSGSTGERGARPAAVRRRLPARDRYGFLHECRARTLRGRVVEIARREGRAVLACAGAHGTIWAAVRREDGLVVACYLRRRVTGGRELYGLVCQGEGLETVSGFDERVYSALFGLLTPPREWPLDAPGREGALSWHARVARRGALDRLAGCQFLPDGLPLPGTCAQFLAIPEHTLWDVQEENASQDPARGAPGGPECGMEGGTRRGRPRKRGRPARREQGVTDPSSGTGVIVPSGAPRPLAADDVAALPPPPAAMPLADRLMPPCAAGLRVSFQDAGARGSRARPRPALMLPFWDEDAWYSVSRAVIVLDYTRLAWEPDPALDVYGENGETARPRLPGRGKGKIGRGISLRRYRELLMEEVEAGPGLDKERVERMVAALARWREERERALFEEDEEGHAAMPEGAAPSRLMPRVLANCDGTFNGVPFSAQRGPFMAGGTQVPSPLVLREPVALSCSSLYAQDTLGLRGALWCRRPVRVLEMTRTAAGEVIARVRYPFAGTGRHVWAEAYRRALLGRGRASSGTGVRGSGCLEGEPRDTSCDTLTFA